MSMKLTAHFCNPNSYHGTASIPVSKYLNKSEEHRKKHGISLSVSTAGALFQHDLFWWPPNQPASLCILAN